MYEWINMWESTCLSDTFIATSKGSLEDFIWFWILKKAYLFRAAIMSCKSLRCTDIRSPDWTHFLKSRWRIWRKSINRWRYWKNSLKEVLLNSTGTDVKMALPQQRKDGRRTVVVDLPEDYSCQVSRLNHGWWTSNSETQFLSCSSQVTNVA